MTKPNAGKYKILKFAVIAIVASFLWVIIGVHRHGKVDLNGQQMWNLSQAIQVSQPPNDSEQQLISALAKIGVTEAGLRDAWNHPMIARVWRDSHNAYHYRVASLGSDGLAGPCSVSGPRCESSEADWIIEDGQTVNIPMSRF